MVGRGVVEIIIEITDIVVERRVDEVVANFCGLDSRLDFFCRIR